MDKVLKPSNSEWYTPSSEHFRVYTCLTCCHLKSRYPKRGALCPHTKAPSDFALRLTKFCPLSSEYLSSKLGNSFHARNSSRRNFICGAKFPPVSVLFLVKRLKATEAPGPPCRIPNSNDPTVCLASSASSNPIQSNKLKPFSRKTIHA
jgi:hypothetical protein